jgi:hypothetical protein
MTTKSKIVKHLSLAVAFAGIAFAAGAVTTDAQRDPFKKPGYQTPRIPGKGGVNGKGGPQVVPGLPSIEQRIDYFKRLRQQAADNGMPLPKVTSVLTLDEMAVMGVFRTPRGYAAMVQATPINLSYTIYPGEKFFDGQLVAVEENRLVFRKVSRNEKGKFVSSVDYKSLKQYTVMEDVQGTAPADSKSTETVSTAPAASPAGNAKTAPVKIVSPLDEMNKQAPEDTSDKDKASKLPKKVLKVARNKK